MFFQVFVPCMLHVLLPPRTSNFHVAESSHFSSFWQHFAARGRDNTRSKQPMKHSLQNKTQDNHVQFRVTWSLIITHDEIKHFKAHHL